MSVSKRLLLIGSALLPCFSPLASAAPLTSGATIRLTSNCSGKAFDIAGTSTADGAKVQIWRANSTCAQRWQIETIATAGGSPVLTDNSSYIESSDNFANPERGFHTTSNPLPTNGSEVAAFKVTPAAWTPQVDEATLRGQRRSTPLAARSRQRRSYREIQPDTDDHIIRRHLRCIVASTRPESALATCPECAIRLANTNQRRAIIAQTTR